MKSSKFKTLLFLLRTKGLRYAFNRVHYHLFWELKNPLVTRLLQWLEPYPSYIEVEVTTRCNLKCIMCEHTYWSEPPKDMTLEEFKGIIDQFPNLKWIGLTGIGESFMNKDFLKMLEYVKSKDIIVELYDTFYFIDEETAAKLLEYGVDRILISLDAATKETYEKIRVNSDFDRVTSNLVNLFKMKKEKGAYFPKMAFHYIVNRHNLAEIPLYLDYIKSIVQDDRVFIQFTRMLHTFKEVEDLYTEIPDELVATTRAKAQAMNITVEFNKDTLLKKPDIKECTEFIMPFIFVTGHVIPCCAGNEACQREFQHETALGNIFESRFREIWKGPRYKAFRKLIREGKIPRACNNCCIYNVHP
jgi:MoaA/NifB/PqqE/SkfB family radical SAM enzyme